MARRSTRRIAPKTAPTLKTTLLFAAVALYLGGTTAKLCMQEWNLMKQAQVLEAERSELVAANAELSNQIALCKTNVGIERIARERLGLVMASEIPVKTIVPAPVARAAAAADKAAVGLPPAMAALVKLFTP